MDSLQSRDSEVLQRCLDELLGLKAPPELMGSLISIITNPEDKSKQIKLLQELITHFKSCALKQERQAETEEQGASKTNSLTSWWPGKPKPKVHSVNAHIIVNAKTHGAERDIIRKMEDQHIKLSATVVDECEVVLLFCVVLSRPGSDVHEAMSMIPDGARQRPVVLVMMYHTTADDYAIDSTDLSTEFSDIVCHVNVLFHKSKGLLKCDRNTRAMDKITKVFTNYKH